jgi:hypothetical protein
VGVVFVKRVVVVVVVVVGRLVFVRWRASVVGRAQARKHGVVAGS